MRKAYFLLLMLSSFILLAITTSHNAFSQSGWFPFNLGTTDRLWDVTFPNSLTGFVTSNGSFDFPALIFKTTNGGTNWNNIFPQMNCYITGVSFPSANTGYVTISYGVGHYIYKTTNSGGNWNMIYGGQGYSLDNVTFTDSNTGFFVSDSVMISSAYKTTNAGINWFRQFTFHNYLFSIIFPSADSGYALVLNVSPFSLNIFKTTNGGTSWIQMQTYYVYWSGQISSLYFYNSLVGFFIYYDYPPTQSVFYKTTNGGFNWSQISINPYNDYGNFFFTSLNIGYVTGENGVILKTTNGGYNWVNQRQGLGGPMLNDICFTDANTGYAVGDNGFILKTTNAGEPIGIELISSEIPKQFSLSQNYPNPFNPATKIKFSLPIPSEGGVNVKLVVYDILGREVASLIPPLWRGQEGLKTGTYEVEWDGSTHPSGVYFYKLTTESFSQTKKMVLLK